ncbi:AraC family transcriptional regulator [Aureibacillus halotolerans]|uniref:AraC-like DNA-binding protein n=1 Tax=Aureibacillus halotolerans TaxID=1508390 RepID=A0A4R6U163_9BACI|nr:AraC family transcriptional regulator [Aureibacillus halotolerans]TDQ36784.1 AraC-like DNA-binding protein [Aureibacillus halotolerans]
MSTFKRMLVSYVCILLIPLFTGLISYYVSVSVAKSNAVDSSLAALNQSRTSIENRMLEVESFIRELSLQPNVNRLLAGGPSLEDQVMDVRSVTEQLSVYASTNQLLDYLQLYIWDADMVLIPGSAYARPQHFFNEHRILSMTFQEWRDEMIFQPHNHRVRALSLYNWNKRTIPMVTLMQSLPFHSNGNVKATVLIPIEKSWFQQQMNSFVLPGGWAYIKDEHGNLLANAGISSNEVYTKDFSDEEQVVEKRMKNGEDMYIISVTSDQSGWQYVASVPKTSLLKGADFIGRMTFVVMLVTLLIGGVISVLLAKRHSSPIAKLATLIREHLDHSKRKETNEYAFLEGNLAKLIKRNNSLAQELTQQERLQKDAFLRRLIHGEFHSRDDLHASALDAGVTPEDYGVVLLLKIHGYEQMEGTEVYDELSAAKIIVKNHLQHFYPQLLTVDLNKDEVLMWIVLRPDKTTVTENTLREQLIQERDELPVEYGLDVTYAVGPLTSLPETGMSYDMARRLLDYAILKSEPGVYWHSDYDVSSPFLNYSIEMEVRLFTALKSGEVEDALQLIRDILNAQVQEKQHPMIAQQVLSQLKGTFMRALSPQAMQLQSDVQLQQRLFSLEMASGSEYVLHVFSDIIHTYATQQRQVKEAAGEEVLATMMHYIDQHSHDANLSNYDIAKAIGKPEKYLSRLFQEQRGHYIAEYIEHVRLEKSTILLTSTEDTIQDISEKVGYNSSHSFRRAFKRVFEVTPAQYRSSLGKSARDTT